MDEPGAPGQPGNQAPVIRAPRSNWLKKMWNWLLEETTEEVVVQAPRRTDGKKKGKKGKKGNKGNKGKERAPGSAPTAGLAGPIGEEVGQEPAAAAGEAEAEHSPAQDPAPRTDRSWKTTAALFFRSKRRFFVGARLGVLLFVVLATAWVSMYTVTGFNPVERAFITADPEDPTTWYRTPFFIVESGSMMRPDAPFGRLGTIDPGDVVVIRKVDTQSDIQTFYGPGDRKTAGAHGDVIVFVPAPTRDNPFPQPVVHRAVAWLERDFIQIPNPNPAPGAAPTVSVPRFTVEEFGVFDARAVTIPELGLYNYQPDRSGFITRGDNPRTNDLADQALGVTVHPVEMDRILGRVVHTIPYVGLARIALMGQDPGMLSPDPQWCAFLAGQAPCDNWVVFLVVLFVFVGVPFALTVALFARRAGARWRERRRFEREQEEALVRYEKERALRDKDAPGDGVVVVQAHDALDLLAGRVAPVGWPRRAPRRDGRLRLRSGVHYHAGRPPVP